MLKNVQQRIFKPAPGDECTRYLKVTDEYDIYNRLAVGLCA